MGGTLNVELTGMLVENFLENPKNTQIAILWALLGKMASIFQKFSRRPCPCFLDQLVASDEAIFSLNSEVSTHNVIHYPP